MAARPAGPRRSNGVVDPPAARPRRSRRASRESRGAGRRRRRARPSARRSGCIRGPLGEPRQRPLAAGRGAVRSVSPVRRGRRAGTRRSCPSTARAPASRSSARHSTGCDPPCAMSPSETSCVDAAAAMSSSAARAPTRVPVRVRGERDAQLSGGAPGTRAGRSGSAPPRACRRARRRPPAAGRAGR